MTYEMMAAYWPTAGEEDPVIARAMNSLSKIVFSKSLENADWNNARVVRDVVPEDIMNLKQMPGKDMVIYGSGILVSDFARKGLLDEYRLIVNPVVLGTGKPLFKGFAGKQKMELLKTKALGSGNVLTSYAPVP